MVELSSFPSASEILNGLSQSVITGTAPNQGCSGWYFQNYVIVLGKPINGLPLLVPAKDVSVYFSAATFGKAWVTNNYGVASVGCIWQYDVVGYMVKVQHPNLNFGNGFGQFSNWIYRNVLDKAKPIIVQGDMKMPCGNLPSIPINPPSLTSPASILNISTPALSFDFPGYGNVFPSNSSPFSFAIQIDGNQVANGTIGDSRIVNFNFGSILSVPSLKSLLGKKEVNIKVIVTYAGCTREGNIYVNFPNPCTLFKTMMNEPSLPPIIAPATSLFVNLTGIRLECPDNPDANKILDKIKGTVSLGNFAAVPFDISQGSATFDLSKLFQIVSLPR